MPLTGWDAVAARVEVALVVVAYDRRFVGLRPVVRGARVGGTRHPAALGLLALDVLTLDVGGVGDQSPSSRTLDRVAECHGHV